MIKDKSLKKYTMDSFYNCSKRILFFHCEFLIIKYNTIESVKKTANYNSVIKK